MRIVFLGPPGSGKGTQCGLLVSHLKVPHISTGEMLRKSIRSREAVGLKVEGDLKAGRLAADAIVIDLVEQRLEEPDCNPGFLLDGYPRTTYQALALETCLMSLKRPLDGVLELCINSEVLVERLAARAKIENRADDNPDVIRTRLQQYQRATFPLVQFYSKRKQHYSVDGLGTVEEVFERIKDALEAIRTKNKR